MFTILNRRKPSATLLDEFEELYDLPSGLWRLPSQITEPLTPELIAKWKQECDLMPSPVEREVGRFYRSLIHLLQPACVLETGTNFGYSAWCLGTALSEIGGDRALYTVDLWDCHHVFQGSPAEPFIHFIQGSSLEVDLDLLPGSFDMLALDSDHRYDTIMGELNRFAPLLAVGGTAILHDTLYFDGVGLAVKALMQSGAFDVVTLPTPRHHGTGIRPPGVTIARKMAEVAPGFLPFDETLSDVEVCLGNRTDRDAPVLARIATH